MGGPIPKHRRGPASFARLLVLAASLAMPAFAGAEESEGIRMMLKVQIPAEAGNEAVKNGTMKPIIEKAIEQIKPEAAYFTQEDGLRTIYFVYRVKDTAEFSAVHEPLMQGLGALVYDMPAQTWEDLSQGFESIGENQ